MSGFEQYPSQTEILVDDPSSSPIIPVAESDGSLRVTASDLYNRMSEILRELKKISAYLSEMAGGGVLTDDDVEVS